ncbi:MAG: cellulose binding domain-containing protein [Chloroflexota bacterium]
MNHLHHLPLRWGHKLFVVSLLLAFLLAMGLAPASAAPTKLEPGNCQVTYTPNGWNSGFTAEIKITNNSTSAVQGWTLAYSYADGQQVTSAWNATVTQSGANVTASNPSSHWNGNIPANGGSVSFGVQGTHSGANTNPTAFLLNGVTCNGGTVVPTTAVPTTPTNPATHTATPTATFISGYVRSGSSTGPGLAGISLYYANEYGHITFLAETNANGYYQAGALLPNGTTFWPALPGSTAPNDAFEPSQRTFNGTASGNDFVATTITTPTTVVPTTAAPTTVVPPTSMPGVCQVSYTANQWSSGFTAEIKITNNSASAIQGWTLAYSYADGQQVTSAWNATVTQSGANVTASNPTSHWNGNIPANGGSVSFGVQGTHSGANTNPTAFLLNGVTCNGGTVVPTTAVPPSATPTAPTSTPPTATPPTTTPPTATPPTTTPEGYTGNATYFDALGMPYGGCGITQAALDSQNFVAFNVQDTPGDYATMLTRPIAPQYASQIGMFNNGLNCGRWIRVTIGDYCTGINDGAPNASFCRNGSWISDAYNGATLDFIVADSCQDANGWCRDDRYHVDLAKGSLSLFMKDGQPVGNLLPDHWNNRQVTWEFVEAPGYTGDINIGFLKDAQIWWTPIGITHLQNGIHGVDYYENGAWVAATMNADMGQSYLIRPTTNGGTSYRIRVYDANDQLINNGRIYNFSLPASCNPQCSGEFNAVTYTVE